MANVTQYSVAVFGGVNGRHGLRVRIQLAEDETTLGTISFYEPGVPFPADSSSDDKVLMHLPLTLLPAVVDLLRNEKPVIYFLSANGAVLSTSAEPVGEEEGNLGVRRDRG